MISLRFLLRFSAFVAGTTLFAGWAQATDAKLCARKVVSSSARTFCISQLGTTQETLQITSDLGGPVEFKRSVFVGEGTGARTVIYSKSKPLQPQIKAQVDFSLSRSGEIQKAFLYVGTERILSASEFEKEALPKPAVDPTPLPEPAIDPSRPTRIEIDPAALPASAELKAAVANFEKMGGRGKWLTATVPAQFGGKNSALYLIQLLPETASLKAEMVLLKNQRSLDSVKNLFSKGALLVLGESPFQLNVQFQAAVLSKKEDWKPEDGDLLQRASDAAGLPLQDAAFLVTTVTPHYTFAHEAQHWLDYTSKSYSASVESTLNAFAKKHDVNGKVIGWVKVILLEYRGHLAQYLQAYSDSQKGLSYPGVNGLLETDASESQYGFETEMSNARQFFEQAYREVGMQLRKILGDQPREELLKLLLPFELPTPEGTLRNKPKLSNVL